MKIIVVKALIFYKNPDDKKHSLLLLERASHKTFPGMEDLPGGKVDAGESLLQAIIREIKEETGLHITNDINPVTTYTWYDASNNEYEEHLFYTSVNTQEITIQPNEHRSFRWIDSDAINESAVHPTMNKIITTALRTLQSHF